MQEFSGSIQKNQALKDCQSDACRIRVEQWGQFTKLFALGSTTNQEISLKGLKVLVNNSLLGDAKEIALPASLAVLSAMPVVSTGVKVSTAATGSLVNIAPTTRVISQYGPMTQKGPLPQFVADTFRSATYVETVTTKPTTLYRVYGGSASQLGGYWTTTKPTGPVQSIIDSALNPVWGNNATKVVEIEVPKGVRLYQGQAAKQGGLMGGGNQVVFPRDVKINQSWIVK